ncbi:MAG: hypothetical protein MUD05_06955 [Candidatus Nanopelagicales bacterium]|jgi:hypothetical protein|nr:hypothetical protein [Candidatus Nanopelagicales bacterium]
MSDSLQDLSTTLTNNYLLVNVSLASWAARASDKTLAAETAASHGAIDSAVSVTKKLLAGADEEHKAVLSAQNAVRSFVYDRTIPYSRSGEDAKAKRGPRLLPVVDSLEFMADLKPLNAAFKAAMADFKAVYAARVAAAQSNLGSISADYPDPSELDGMFSVRVDFEPVPSMQNFTRMSIPAAVAEALGKRLAARQEESLRAGFADLRDRIAAELSRTVTQLTKVTAGEKTKLYETLSTNVRTLVDLLKATTPLVGDSPDLARLTSRLEILAATPVETYKTSVGAAQDSLAVARDALADLDAIEWF